MKLIQIISKSKDGNRMEVIAKEPFQIQKTLHIRKENNIWRYFAGCDEKGNKVYLPIIV